MVKGTLSNLCWGHEAISKSRVGGKARKRRGGEGRGERHDEASSRKGSRRKTSKEVSKRGSE